jgi:hypothetical protein
MKPEIMTLLLGALAAGFASAESVEEAARREQQRRASYGPAAPVIGSEELKRPTSGAGTFSAPAGVASRPDMDVRAGGELEALQAAARRRLGIEYARIAPQAQKLREDASRYAGLCQRVTRPPARCSGDAARLGARAAALSRRLQAADDVGRQARLLPGDVRALEQEHGLEDLDSSLRQIALQAEASTGPGEDAEPPRASRSGTGRRRSSRRGAR